MINVIYPIHVFDLVRKLHSIIIFKMYPSMKYIKKEKCVIMYSGQLIMFTPLIKKLMGTVVTQWYSVTFAMVRDSPEALSCVFEQATLSSD